MYKDVWKRIWAFMMVICLVATMVEWPTTVWAGQGTVNTYQSGSGDTKVSDATSMAVVFTANQNGGGAELLSSIDFDAHLDGDSTASATIAYCMNLTSAAPDSGTPIFQKEISIVEGTNTYNTGLKNQVMEGDSSFSIMITLSGATFYTYSTAYAGQSYVSSNGGWQTSSAGAAAITAYTNNATAVSLGSSAAVSATSLDDDSDSTSNASMYLNKSNMMIAVDWIDTDLTLINATGTVTWSSADTSVVAVTGGGSAATIRGVALGSTTITAQCGGQTFTCNITVTPKIDEDSITLAPESATYNGSQQVPTVSVEVGGYTLTYTEHYQINYRQVTDGNTVDLFPATDSSVFVDAGTYYIAVTGQNGYSGTYTKEYVIEPKAVTDTSIEVELADGIDWDTVLAQAAEADEPSSILEGCFTYVGDSERGVELSLGTDYTLAVGEDGASITLSGTGNYTGNRYCGAPRSLTEAVITFDKSGYVYTGKEWTPAMEVTVDGVTLSQSDYTVVYENNVEANDTLEETSRAKVTITGTGSSFYGEQTAYFTIVPKDIGNEDKEQIGMEVTVVAETAGGDDAETAEPVITMTYNGMTLAEGTDYTIDTSVTAVEGGTYRRVLYGIGNYTGYYTVEYSVGTALSNYIESVSADDVTYDGTAKTPAYTIAWVGGSNTAGLAEGVDYTVTYTNNVNAGTATIKLQGIGTYGGSISGTFTIQQADISSAVCRFIDEDGEEHTTSNYSLVYSPYVTDMKPGVAVKFASGSDWVTLPESDYSLTYSVDTNPAVGDQTVTITPNNSNFTQTTKTLTYTVTKCGLNNSKITATIDREVFDYTGAEIDPPTESVVYRSASGQTCSLAKGTDYTVMYSSDSIKDIGDYQAIITGTGNYSGALTLSFEVVAVDISTLVNGTNMKIVNPDEQKVSGYTGPYWTMLWIDESVKSNNKLQIQIADGEGNTLEEGTDYELTDWTNLGEVSKNGSVASVTITGKGKYYGSVEVKYLLAAKLEEQYSVSIDDSEKLVYTGEEIELGEDAVTVSNGGFWLWKEVLERDVDYTVSYTDGVNTDAAINAGTATATIEAIPLEKQPTANGCYVYGDETNKLSGTFTIYPKDIATVGYKAISIPYEGEAVTFEADAVTMTYRNQTLVAGTDYTLLSDTFMNNGGPTSQAQVLVEGKGNYTGTKVIIFTITGKSLDEIVSWKVDASQTTYTGERLYPAITELTLSDGTVLTEDSDIRTIIAYDNSSYEDNLDAGTAGITVSGRGDYWGSADRTLTFTIEPRNLTDNCTVIGAKSAGYTYTSQEITPTVTVQCTDLKTTLKSTDYDISYEDNINVGTGSIIIEGKGNYTGTYTEEFSVLAKDISEDDVVIADIDDQTYEGIAVTPAPVVSYEYGDGTYILSAESDYTIAYADNQGAGTATVTVTGKGNFTGEKSTTFRIGQAITNEEQFEISCPSLTDGTEFVYTGSAYRPAVTVKRIMGSSTKSLAEGTDYEVVYGENTNAGTGTITVTGIGVYTGTWEAEFTIEPRNLSDSAVALAIEGVTDGSYETQYTGSAVEPEVTLTYNGNTIDAADYTISYSTNHTDRGIVTLTVTANSDTNFTGTRSTTYTIGLASIGNGGYVPGDGFRIGAIEPQALVDGVATPQPVLYYNGAELVLGTDYICTYENNTKTGSDAVVILTGCGNYTGSVKKKFEICGNIADAEITVPDELWFKDYVDEGETSIAYGEKNITFDDDVKVVMDGTELVQGTDYTLSYSNNTWVGTASVTVKGMGSWAGSAVVTVPIKADLSEEGIEMSVGNQSYTGNPIAAVPVITYYGTALSSGTHFIIYGYENNTNIGTDTASVTVIGNTNNGFSGELTGTFSIVAATGVLTISGVEESYKYRGDQITPSITVKSGSKTLTAGTDYAVTYGANVNAGTDAGTIVVKGKNSYDGIIEMVTFDIEAQNMDDLSIMDGNHTSVQSRVYTGKEIEPELTLTVTIGTTKFTLPSSSYTVAKKEGADNTNVGTGTLVFTGDGVNIIGSKEVSFKITAKSLAVPTGSATDTISMEVMPDSYTYDGTEKKPTVIVTYQYGTETQVRQLTEGTDYTVAYSNNIKVGTAKVTVTGQGNYTNSRTAEFTITEKDFTGAVVSFPNGSSYPYMGSNIEIQPDVTVTLDGITLTKGTDYTVTYQNNKAVGEATVVVTGKGSYTGSVTKTFTIAQHDISASDISVASIPNQAYTGSPVVPDITVTCGDYVLQYGTDYTLTFATDNTEIGTVLMNINGTGGFTGYRQATFTIASDISNATVTGIADSYPYTGTAYTADDLGITKVSIGSTVLTTDDYYFEYATGSDGTSAGEQTLLMIGKGSYGGKKKITFTITPKDISEDDVVMTGFEETVAYSQNITQDVKLTWGSISLVKTVDYKVTCSPSGTAGAYEMVVAGIGNYTGTVTKQFTVEQTSIDGIEIKGISSTYTYTGEAIEPELTVWLDGTQLTADTDYTVSFENNVDAGIAKITITGTGSHYYGSEEVSFTILRKSIHLCSISSIPTQTYTGEDIKPTVTVEDGGTTLTLLTDYTLMYSNNRKAGTGVVAVAGKGNYTATKNLTFDIRPCDVSAAAVTASSSNTITLKWTGEGTVTGYEVYRLGTDGVWVRMTRTRNTYYTDTQLTASTSYSYMVRTYLVSDGETYYGEFTDVVTGTTTK